MRYVWIIVRGGNNDLDLAILSFHQQPDVFSKRDTDVLRLQEATGQ